MCVLPDDSERMKQYDLERNGIMVNLSKSETQMLFNQVSDHCKALKNWIATAVESEEYDRARVLVTELREYQSLYSKLNGALKTFQ